MARLFVEPNMVLENSILIDDRDDIRHISKVLRLGIGDAIDISDKSMWEYSCEIISVEQDEIEVKILDKQKFAREPSLYAALFQGIPKAGKMETIIQKCVEMGVSQIVPVWTKRTVVTDKGNFGKKIERWQKISDEAVKQCKRGIIPEISTDLKFNETINELLKYDLILFPYENEEDYSIKDCLRELEKKPAKVAIIIGPEGGFANDEADALKKIGAKCVTLGKTILRTETAGLAALAMTMYELEL